MIPNLEIISNIPPDMIKSLGPAFIVLCVVVYCVILVIKEIRSLRKLRVETADERVKEAEDRVRDVENRSNAEIVKVYAKLEEMERKIDQLIEERDTEREAFAQRTAAFTKEMLTLEQRHQEELESVNKRLVHEMKLRHVMEQMLVTHGIEVPLLPDPSVAPTPEQPQP